ncbi:hypothetical protein [uncultured Alistipes sp.]|uniref:hypothetical protein n=1 Tax=uncultured Alistipes sp. TaxID=538949 RepID=UPI0025D36766|nr:hypothetical protein [uncultured Alistipes sp.]
MPNVRIEFLVDNKTQPGLSGIARGFRGMEKNADGALAKIRALEALVERLRQQKDSGFSKELEKYKAQIEELNKRIEKLQATAQSTKVTPPGLPKATQQFNGLNFSIQQIARELPSLAMGPQMFFLAISNNLPIFTDQLAIARKQFEALTAAGQKATPVWRQVLSSIVSWQTALAVGIMLSVTYGKEIGNFFKELVSGKKEFDAATEAAERFHATMAKGRVEAQKEITQLGILYRVATDAKQPYDERLAAVKELQREYPAYFGNLSEEQILIGQSIDQYNSLRDAIIATSKARAAEKALAENQEQLILLEQTGDAYEQYKRALNDVAEAEAEYDAADKEFDINPAGVKVEITDELVALKGAKNRAREARKELEKELLKLPGGKELWQNIKENYKGNVNNFVDYIQKVNDKLSSVAEDIVLDPKNANKVAKKNARDLAKEMREAAAKERKAAAAERKEEQTENLNNRYEEKLLRQKQEYDQLLVEQEEKGFDKERAAIRTRHKKRIEEYEMQEKELIALVKKLRAAGKDLGKDAEKEIYETTALKKIASQKVQDRELAEVDKNEYDRFLSNYESYLQGRERITKKYNEDIAKLTDNDRKAAAERAKKKALDDFAVEFAGQFPEFEAWADRIVGMSAQRLKELLSQARTELERLQADPSADQNAIAQAQAKVVKLEKLIPKVENKATDTTRWRDLHTVLKDVIDTFNEVGDSIGGAGGEIVKVMGNVAGATLQMVDSIKAFQEASEKGDKLGMATGILGAISAGLSLITTLAGLFGGESSWERNLRLAREFNEELRIARERLRIDSDEFSNVFGDRLFARYRQNVDVAREALEKLEEVQERIINRGEEIRTIKGITNTGLDGLENIPKTWENPAASIRNMQVQTRHSTWFRSAKYSSLEKLLPELFNGDEVDMELLRKFVEEGDETFQHLSKANQEMLKQMVADWETYEEAIGSVRDYLSEIFGGLGSSLTDALVDAFENGTDAAEVFTESVGQALRKLAKEMIYSQTLGKVFDDAQKRVEEIYKSDSSSETKFAKWSEVMQQLITDAMGQQEEFNSLWAEFQRLAEKNGISIADPEATTQTGKAGALQTVTQDSFSRLEGLVTSIQIHAASLDDEFEGSSETLAQSLGLLQAIASNTEPIRQIYDLLVQLDQAGVKIKG